MDAECPGAMFLLELDSNPHLISAGTTHQQRLHVKLALILQAALSIGLTITTVYTTLGHEAMLHGLNETEAEVIFVDWEYYDILKEEVEIIHDFNLILPELHDIFSNIHVVCFM